MIPDLQLTVGDVCRDATGLCVMVDDIDPYNRVQFSVIEEGVENWTVRGEMSRDAFMRRFMRLNTPQKRAA